ncbi:MucBP domain-containing protein [Levilactobacillus cerevisiae]|uniref:MucBP domain-containing protein n=1 Tax=Levilactobacillus cerevisiae TaxID=1704076 RepID=UPI000F76DE34|nr:MucBP domain-containing protein [Levilactobacillus cerevisiae]
MGTQGKAPLVHHEQRWERYWLFAALALIGVSWQFNSAVSAAADVVKPVTTRRVPVAEAETPEADVPSPEHSDPQNIVGTQENANDQVAEGETEVRSSVQDVPLVPVQSEPVQSQSQQRKPQHQVRRATVREAVESSQPGTAVQPTTVVQPTVVQPTTPPVTTAEPSQTPQAASATPGTIDQWMPNKTLQQAVWIQLGKDRQPDHKTWASPAEITQDDMARLEGLHITGNTESSGLSTYIDGHTEFSLAGLEFAVNMRAISLGGGMVNNPPFRMFGDVVDISPLAKMPKLESVILDNNRIKSIAPLKGLTKLFDVFLTFNQITDFSPLKNLKLWQLTIGDQYLILPAIKIDPAEAVSKREHTMTSPYVLPDGTVPLLYTPGNFFELDVGYHYDENEFDYVALHNLENEDVLLAEDVPGAPEGSVVFTNIPDQKPGDKQPLEEYQLPSPEYYYLVAQEYVEDGTVKSEDSSIELYVIQPYIMGQQAGQITVQYQDEKGQTIAPPETLPAGQVGDPYNTGKWARAIKGYTLLTPAPTNAAGTYTTEPITVTYVYRRQSPEKVRPGVTQPVTTVPTKPVEPIEKEPAPIEPGEQPDRVVTQPDQPGQMTKVPLPAINMVIAGLSDKVPTPIGPASKPASGPVELPLPPRKKTTLPRTNEAADYYGLIGGIGLLLALLGLGRERKNKRH